MRIRPSESICSGSSGSVIGGKEPRLLSMYSLSFCGISMVIIGSCSQRGGKSPRPHPLLGRRDGGIRFPESRPLRVKARTDWHRVDILVILARALEHLAEGDDGWCKLVLSWIDPTGK